MRGEAMSITVQHQKESIGQAYVRAVVAKAGFNIAVSEHDYGVDGLIKDVANRGGRHFETGFGINFQLKSSVDVILEDDFVVYDLESKNYNDLVFETGMLPNILVLLVMPRDEQQWVSVGRDQLSIRHCAWWCSLAGLDPTENTETKRIKIPISQVFNPENLTDLMSKVKGGQRL